MMRSEMWFFLSFIRNRHNIIILWAEFMLRKIMRTVLFYFVQLLRFDFCTHLPLSQSCLCHQLHNTGRSSSIIYLATCIPLPIHQCLHYVSDLLHLLGWKGTLHHLMLCTTCSWWGVREVFTFLYGWIGPLVTILLQEWEGFPNTQSVADFLIESFELDDELDEWYWSMWGVEGTKKWE